MADENRRATEAQMTTKRDTIKEWAEQDDVVPARHSRKSGPHGLMLARESELGDEHERVDWDEFFSTFNEGDMVVLYDEAGEFEVTNRDTAVKRATIESEEVESALLEGETVRSEITETTVIERTVVEEATIESEIVGRDIVEETIQNAELVSRDAGGCRVLESEASHVDTSNFEQFMQGAHVTDEFDVEVTAEETWMLTKEVLERLRIESQVVDLDHMETDTIESDEIKSSIDIEGIQETILESDLLDADISSTEVVESDSIHTEFGEGDIIQTSLLQHNTVDEKLTLQKRFTGTITEGETVSADTLSSEVIESSIVEERDVRAVETEITETVTETNTSETVTETNTTRTTDTGEAARFTPSEKDEGKTVVDSTGEKVGMVVEVQGDTMYVDPHPSLADRIKTALDWGGKDDDSYPINASQIENITRSKVELKIEE